MQKNILLPFQMTNLLNFTSEGLKKFIYLKVEDKIAFHSWAAGKIKNEKETFNRAELARQFTLSYRFKESYDVIKRELKEAEKISAFSYMKMLLRRYLSFPLGLEDKSDIKQSLSSVLFNLSEFKNATELINELLSEELTTEKRDELLILKASCLIGSENYEEGKNLLNELINRTDDVEKIQKLLPVSANVEFELNNYVEAKIICLKVIEGNKVGMAEKGKCYNLLGLISIIAENNLASAIEYFELSENVYKKSGNLYKVAQMEMNMGNIYNIKGEHEEAEEYWNRSLALTSNIGNLELEGKLQLNFGIYYFEKPNFETAMEYYNRALSIFVSLGNTSGQGLVQYNMAETYLLTCEFEKAIEAATNSIKITGNLKNLNEELESLFLYGKVCFITGDLQGLNIIIEEISKKITDNKVIEKHRTNYNFLKLVNQKTIQGVDFEETLNSMSSIRDWYLEKEDKNNYFFSAVFIIETLINLGFYDEAYSRIQDSSFTGLCQGNKLYNAEKNYLAALISTNKDSAGNPVDYLMDAYGFISEFSITELTWKVLYKLAVIYYERGNFPKSKEFNLYAVSVLDYIFNNCKSQKIRRYVSERIDRKEAYDRLKTMHSLYE